MNHPFERILLATEHTEFDQGSERVAFAMAQRCGLPLMAVLPVVSNPEFEIVAPQLAARNDREAAAKIDDLHNTATQLGVSFEIHVRHGVEPYREIVNKAEEKQADLIVMRRRGKRSFLAKLLLGEMVSKVAGYASCNVLLVPRNCIMWSRGVLAAVDDSEQSMSVTIMAAAVAKECALPLTILSVAETGVLHEKAEAVVARHAGAVADLDIVVRQLVLAGRPHEQIIAAGKSAGCDLIVVGRRGASNAVVRMLLGGTMQKVAEMADQPVLIVSV
ncbi:MAG TPA: universal stress protein [Gallionella sp.]|jgi:nucleotide-binding universal stress UspA family protein|nr:universal stress protein [Gallionella sp.]